MEIKIRKWLKETRKNNKTKRDQSKGIKLVNKIKL